MDQARRPVWFLEVNRSDSQLMLEQCMSFLYIWLILVDEQHILFRRFPWFEIGDQREHTIGSSLGTKRIFISLYSELKEAGADFLDGILFPGPTASQAFCLDQDMGGDADLEEPPAFEPLKYVLDFLVDGGTVM